MRTAAPLTLTSPPSLAPSPPTFVPGNPAPSVAARLPKEVAMSRTPHTRLFHSAPLLLLAATIALGVGARSAAADPCKADGQVCRTNQSCCGTNGHNGVCAKASSKKFGTCCTPTTCAAQGAACGMIPDGSCPDMLVCGTCPDDEICTAAHVCETTTTTTTTTSTSTTTLCAPTTCTDSNCGQTPDGCGGMIECPCNTCTITCVNGFTISSPCVLTPDSCSFVCPFDCIDTCGAHGCSTNQCARCSQ